MPKRSYTLEELRLNKIQPEQLLSPTDTVRAVCALPPTASQATLPLPTHPCSPPHRATQTLNGVRNVLQGGFVAGLAAAYFGGVDASQLVQARRAVAASMGAGGLVLHA